MAQIQSQLQIRLQNHFVYESQMKQTTEILINISDFILMTLHHFHFQFRN